MIKKGSYMQIKHFDDKNIFEGLLNGEYYVWKILFQDGTSTPVKIKWDETSKESLEKHFGKEIASIDKDFSVHGGHSGHNPQTANDYHRDQDRAEAGRVKPAAFTTPRFESSEGIFADADSLEESGRVESPVSRALISRIAHQRNDLMRYGPDAVMTAIDWVADSVGKVDEIGTSDVSGWVQQVERYLRSGGVGISEASMGGINRCAPAQDVSYEKVLNDVTDKWRGQKVTVNELSVKKLRQYSQGVQQMDPATTPKYKMVKHGEGYAKAGRRIAHMTGDRSNKMYESKLGEFLAEADANQFTDILNKQDQEKQAAKPKQKVVDIDFHGWTIRYRPSSDNSPVQWLVLDKKGEIKNKGTAGTDTDAVRDAEDWIKSGGGTGGTATSRVTVDFNAPFAKQFAPGGETFYATVESDGKSPMLIFSKIPQDGFKTSHTKPVKSGIGSPVIALTPKECNAAGLQPNGRYILGAEDKIDDNTSMFPLIFQNVTQSSSDRMRLGAPGITVAATRD